MKTILRMESVNDSPIIEIARDGDNFFRRRLLPDGTEVTGQSDWEQMSAQEVGQVITTPIDTEIKRAIVTSLYKAQIGKKGGKPRLENPSTATAYQRERRRKLKDG